MADSNAFNNSSETSDQRVFDQETREHFQNEFGSGNVGPVGTPGIVRAGSTTTIQSHDTHASGVGGENLDNGNDEAAEKSSEEKEVEKDKDVEKEAEKVEEVEKPSGPQPVKQR